MNGPRLMIKRLTLIHRGQLKAMPYNQQPCYT